MNQKHTVLENEPEAEWQLGQCTDGFGCTTSFLKSNISGVPLTMPTAVFLPSYPHSMSRLMSMIEISKSCSIFELSELQVVSFPALVCSRVTCEVYDYHPDLNPDLRSEAAVYKPGPQSSAPPS